MLSSKPRISAFDRQTNAHFRGAARIHAVVVCDLIRVWYARRPTDFWTEQHVAVMVRDFDDKSGHPSYFEMIDWVVSRGFKIKEFATRKSQRFFSLRMTEDDFFEFKVRWL